MPERLLSGQSIEEPLYIGLTGTMASGKGETVNIFKTLDFATISLSDIVREEASKKGHHKINRQDMQDIGNELRKREGTAFLARRVREKIQSSEKKKWIIDGIRNPAEVRELKKLGSFYLIGIQSDREIILKRIQWRKRETDRISQVELENLIDREWGKGEGNNGQRVGACIKMSDYIIENNRGLADLKKKCLDILKEIGNKHGR